MRLRVVVYGRIYLRAIVLKSCRVSRETPRLPVHRVSTPAHAHHDLFSQRSDTPGDRHFFIFQHTGFLLLGPQCGERHYGLSILQGRFFDCLWDSVAYLERNAGWMDLRKKWLAGWFVGRLACVCLSIVTRPCRIVSFVFPRTNTLWKWPWNEGSAL